MLERHTGETKDAWMVTPSKAFLAQRKELLTDAARQLVVRTTSVR